MKVINGESVVDNDELLAKKQEEEQRVQKFVAELTKLVEFYNVSLVPKIEIVGTEVVSNIIIIPSK